MSVKIPQKPRKHRWVTEALNRGEIRLSVWPSPEDLTSDRKKENFLQVIAKVGNDPRVVKVEKFPHPEHNIVFLFHLADA